MSEKDGWLLLPTDCHYDCYFGFWYFVYPSYRRPSLFERGTYRRSLLAVYPVDDVLLQRLFQSAEYHDGAHGAGKRACQH